MTLGFHGNSSPYSWGNKLLITGNGRGNAQKAIAIPIPTETAIVGSRLVCIVIVVMGILGCVIALAITSILWPNFILLRVVKINNFS
ncbi:MAG: hypothetical protein V7L05_18170 [Nostoc sp.]|uniref:hypothetical protein n=1 Tax=Nostoc sp. TaxID=1180 RepID=UPI002FF7C288